MDLIKELLEFDQNQASDAELAQATADIQRRFGRDPERAKMELDKWKRARLQRVDPRTRALMQQKERMNQQIDSQIDRQRETQAVGASGA